MEEKYFDLAFWMLALLVVDWIYWELNEIVDNNESSKNL